MIGVVTLIPTESQLNLSHPSPLIAVSTQPSRATTVWLAINPVARRVIALQAAILALTAPLYPLVGISIRWSTALPYVGVLSFMLGVWLLYVLTPSRRRKIMFAEALLATLLLVLFTNIVGAAQYPVLALGFPAVDRWLAASDAALGIHVPTLTAWTGSHPTFTRVLILSYFSLLPQFVLPIIALGMFYRDRIGMWEYIFHFHFCLAVALLCVALMPATVPISYYGFESLIDQTRFINHFARLRSGTFTELAVNEIEGMISFPSFHVAGGLMVTWAFRGHRRWFAALVVLNTLLIVSTVLTGVHYAIDVVGAVVLFAGSVLLWRGWGRNGLTQTDIGRPGNPRLRTSG
jgi:membrane-associated phospholipid phosphatase